MNLHAMTTGYTAAVSPPTIGALYTSAGYAVVNYAQVPKWNATLGAIFDVQALSGSDIKQVDALNIQGIMRAVYLMGSIEGLDRQTAKGGDILGFDGRYWLVATVLEPWSNNGWTKVAVVMQNGAPSSWLLDASGYPLLDANGQVLTG